MCKKLLILICIVVVAGNNSLFPSIPTTIQSNSSNDLCRNQSEEYVSNLKNLSLWAHEMLDSSAKSSAGVLRGSRYNLGNYRQCLSSRAPFTTQYCLITVTANVSKPKPNRHQFSLHYDPHESVLNKLYNNEDLSQLPRNAIRIGWCTPASCTPLELENHLNNYFSSTNDTFDEENVTYFSKVPKAFCKRSNDEKSMDGLDITFCILASVLTVLVVISTFWDFIYLKKASRGSAWENIFMAFSARKGYSDLKRLESPNRAMNILSGIKSFSIFMIIIDHRLAFPIASILSNFDTIEHMYRNPLISCLLHGDLFVDTFFVISGVLVVYNLLNLYEKKYMNPCLIIFMRYVRLTPAYAFVVFYYGTVLYHTGSGPLWDAVVGEEIKDCRKNWWANLLYVNTYVDSEHMCMVHSWYLPCDFHYFIIAVALVSLTIRKKKLGISLFVLLTVVSILIPFAIIYIYQRPGILRFYPIEISNPKVDTDFKLTYIKSHTRATPYFIGMFIGYVYYKLKGSEYKVSMLYSNILVVISMFLLLACMFAGSVFYNPFHPYSALESAAYGALHRAVWALATFGIMFATSYGTYEFLYKCLSWRCWTPLSKLVYGAYLVHYAIQIRATYNVVNPIEFRLFDVITYGLSDIVLSFLLSLGLYLTVESPVRRIFKILLFPSNNDEKSMKPDVESQETRSETRL